MTDPDLTSLGLIQVSYLWPGQTDAITGVKSSGNFDYGGEQSIQVLRDVIRFASGTYSRCRWAIPLVSHPCHTTNR